MLSCTPTVRQELALSLVLSSAEGLTKGLLTAGGGARSETFAQRGHEVDNIIGIDS